MKKTLKPVAILVASLTFLTSCSSSGTTNVSTDVRTIEEINASYLEAVDVDYAFNFTKSLEEFKTNEKLGYRTAGSDAEIETGKKIFEEMKKIGLEEVTQDGFILDKWEFEKADMTFTDANGNDYTSVLGGYQTNFDTNGAQEFEVVYANQGTAADLENIDVTDKLVLVDINQRENWWINYPALQAYYKGAKAVIAVQDGGYAEISPDALNAQDVCGPDYAPAFSMSQTDATVLKELIAKNNGVATVTFDAKSTVTFDQQAYNYYGKIIGKDPDSYIILSAHYDSYFNGFQDDNAAIALMLSVAKGLVDSGYQPEKTIIFNALAAEEWGVSNTRYDWSTGAYNQIFNIHPEWAGKAVLNMNFELPAYEHTTQDEIRSSYELKPFLENFTQYVPSVDGVYTDGVSVVAPSRTWSDDFSFSIAGVPALRNDFQDSEFMRSHYHSQFDNEETYNAKALEFHQNLYGLLTIYYDRTAIVPLDFTVRLNALKESINEETFALAGVDPASLISEIDEAIALSETANAEISDLNARYLEAINNNDTEAAKAIYNGSRELNSQLLEIFEYLQDTLVRLTWEDEPIFPHQHAQNNIENLNLSIEALKANDVPTAVDEYLWAIDNNWYAYSFDEEVFNYFTNYVLEQPADRLMWGDGRVVGHENLFAPINSLLAKYDESNPDTTAEVAELTTSLEKQKELLNNLVEEEITTINEFQRMMSELK